MNDQLLLLPSDDSIFVPWIYSWGIELIGFIQKLENPGLTAVMKFISFLGTPLFCIPVILFIYWRLDEKRGFLVGIMIALTVWLNMFLKDMFRQPRPFYFDSSLAMVHESSYGIPSSHAQMSLVFLVPLAVWLIRSWRTLCKRGQTLIWAGVILSLLLTGFSRLYLGVHFPTDILAGWFLGALVLALWFFAVPHLEKLLANREMRVQNLTAALLVLLMNTVYPRGIMLSAVFLGSCLGYTLMKKHVRFSAAYNIKGKTPVEKRKLILISLIRCLIGFGSTAIIYTALVLVLPGEGSLFSEFPVWGQASPHIELGQFLMFVLMGLWAAAGVPRLFVRMGIAASHE